LTDKSGGDRKVAAASFVVGRDAAARRPTEQSGRSPSPRHASPFRRIVPALKPGKITSERFHCEFFGVDFLAGSDAAAAKEWNRRTPALGRVLQEKRQHETRDNEKLPINQEAKEYSAEGNGGGIGFQHAFHVPFAVQTVEATRQSSVAFATRAQNASLSGTVDPFVEFTRCMFADAVLADHIEL
jgi:hypothetical protein